MQAFLVAEDPCSKGPRFDRLSRQTGEGHGREGHVCTRQWMHRILDLARWMHGRDPAVEALVVSFFFWFEFCHVVLCTSQF